MTKYHSDNHRKVLLEWLHEDPSLLPVIRRHIKRVTQEIREENAYIRETYHKEYELEWKNWMIRRAESRIKERETELKRFKFYEQICRGKDIKDDLKIEQAREFPIGEVVGGKEDRHGESRSFFCCPLHNEKTPSFCWYKKNNSFYCFGCGVGGDVITLYMKIHGTSFKETVKTLTV